MRGDRADSREITRFLAGHPPFDALGEELRAKVGSAVHAERFDADEIILRPGDGRVRDLRIIVSGLVIGERPGNGGEGSLVELAEGDLFPLGAVLGERPTRTLYRAQGECLCYRLPHALFRELVTTSAGFRDFCLRGVGSLLDQAQQAARLSASASLGNESRFDAPLAELARREPVTGEPGLSVHRAVTLMDAGQVGSIVVVDAARRPVGIFTLHDLRALLAAGGSLDTTLAAAMTPEPVSLEGSALAFEAVLAMARNRIRHVVVTRDGAVVGVVSERDLFALQRINVVHLMRLIAAADEVDGVAAARAGIPRLIDAMMAHGAGVEQTVRIISLLNDQTVVRVIELCLRDHHPEVTGFTWLAFGSEGRSEQTLVTDQDNGILFDPGDEQPDAVRTRLLPFARHVNEALARCGFPLCKGNIMAGNPELCLSFAEWEALFQRIIASSTPENLLKSTIYFDLRAVRGDTDTAARLQARVLERAARSSLFLHMMAGNALTNRPPLGLFRDFVTERSEEEARGTLDLKVRGLTPFVDGARLLALQAARPETNTLERFAAVAGAGAIDPGEADAWQRSVAYVQLIRMRLHQRQAAAGEPMHNRLDPDTLNPMDRRILKECFRQARALQRRIEVRFQVR